MTDYPHLLAPGAIGALELRNRILMCPMGDHLANDDGTRQRTPGRVLRGAGARRRRRCCSSARWRWRIPRGAYDRRQTAVSDDRFLPGLTGARRAGAPPRRALGAQLVHDGRHRRSRHRRRAGRCSCRRCRSRRAPDRSTAMVTPAEMDGDDRRRSPRPTAQARVPVADRGRPRAGHRRSSSTAAGAVRRDAGFDGVEIHAGHGYLIDEFLSPDATTRDRRLGRLAREPGPPAVRGHPRGPGRGRARLPAVDAASTRSSAPRADGETLDEQLLVVAALAVAAGTDAVHVTRVRRRRRRTGVHRGAHPARRRACCCRLRPAGQARVSACR